jgi:hypothetical protein
MSAPQSRSGPPRRGPTDESPGPAGPAGPSEAKSPAAEQEPPALRPTRWLDRLSVVLLSVALGGVLAAAAPALLRAAGVDVLDGSPSPVRRFGVARPSATMAPFRTPPAPRPAQEDEEEHIITELERLYPEGMWPTKKPRAAGGSREAPRAPAIPLPKGRERIGLTRSPLTLYTKPDATTPPTGVVKADELVLIVKEEGDWVLVIHDGDLASGWTKKSEIAVR